MAELVGISNLNWKLSGLEIGEETEKLINKTKKIYDQLGSLKQEDVCFESTIKVLHSGSLHRTYFFCQCKLPIIYSTLYPGQPG